MALQVRAETYQYTYDGSSGGTLLTAPGRLREHTIDATTSYVESYGVKTICTFRHMLNEVCCKSVSSPVEVHPPVLTHSVKLDNHGAGIKAESWHRVPNDPFLHHMTL